jgi:hypothetical protein
MGRHSAEAPEETMQLAAVRAQLAADPNRKWPPLARVLTEGDRKVLRLFRDRVAVYVDLTDWRLGYKLSPAFHRVSLLPLVIRVQRHRRTPSPVARPKLAGKARAA